MQARNQLQQQHYEAGFVTQPRRVCFLKLSFVDERQKHKCALCRNTSGDEEGRSPSSYSPYFARRLLASSCGQATFEYLLVGMVLLIVFATLGQLMAVVQDGSFVKHAASSASHVAEQVVMGVVGDVFLY